MASVKRKNNKKKVAYKIVISLGYDKDGNKQVQTLTYHPNAKTKKQQDKEAEEYAEKLEARLKRGYNYQDGNITFEELYEEWKRYEGETLARKTYSDYTSIIETKLIPLI